MVSWRGSVLWWPTVPDYSRCRLYLRQSTPLRGAKLWRHWFQPKTAWNFATISVATSASLLILLGMLLVELRLTGAFFWMFLAVGALSLAIQIVSFVIQIISFQAKSAPPQSVPSIIDGRIVMEGL